MKSFFKNILWPKFSEKEATILFYVLIMALLNNTEKVNNTIVAMFHEDPLKTPLLLLLALCIFYFFTYHAFKRKKMKEKEKSSYAYFFYASFSVISLLSVMELYSSPDWSGDILFHKLISLFLMARFGLMFFMTIVLAKANKERVFYLQMTDEQLKYEELGLIAFFGAVFYFSLRTAYGVPSSIIFAYFYLDIALFSYNGLKGFLARFICRPPESSR